MQLMNNESFRASAQVIDLATLPLRYKAERSYLRPLGLEAVKAKSVFHTLPVSHRKKIISTRAGIPSPLLGTVSFTV